MPKVTIYGASDDLIEVDGDLREEFSAVDPDQGDLLAFADGTVLRVRYSDRGVWRIVPVVIAHDSRVLIDPAPENDEDNYSDQATLESNHDLNWVVFGKAIARA